MASQSFLDKVGHVLLVGLKYAFGFLQGFVQSGGPAALTALAPGSGVLEEIAVLVQQAESIGQIVTQVAGQTGSTLDKAALIAPQIEQILLASPLLAGKKIISQPLFQQAVSELNNGVVDLLKAVDGEPPPGTVPTPTNIAVPAAKS